MEEGKGKCPHGEFNLREGCPQCVAEKKAEAEVNSPENIGKRIEEASKAIVESLPTYAQIGRIFEEAAQPKPIIVKVQYYSDSSGKFSSREYTYYSADRLAVGDRIIVPVRDNTVKAMVSAIDVPESEIASFKDKVKTIPPASSLVKEVETKGAEAVFCKGQESIEPDEIPAGGLSEAAQVAGAEVTVVNMETIAKATDEMEEAFEHLDEVEANQSTALIHINPGKAPSFAKHLDAAKRIVEIAASRQILNEGDAKVANDDLNVMAELRKAVDEERKSFTMPLNEHLAAINGAYKLISVPLQEADQITRRLLTAYKVEQQRKAAEAEKLNQDAIDLARRQAEAHNGEFTAEITPIPVPFAPKLTRTDQGKSGLVDNWKFRIVDLEKLPREYMVPDEAMLNSIAKNHHDKKQVAGVEFYNEPGLRVSR